MLTLIEQRDHMSPPFVGHQPTSPSAVQLPGEVDSHGLRGGWGHLFAFPVQQLRVTLTMLQKKRARLVRCQLAC